MNKFFRTFFIDKLQIRIAANEKGLTHLIFPKQRGKKISLGYDEAESNDLLVEAEKQIRSYFAGKLKIFDLSFDVSGTPFQIEVWKAICEIPYGKVLTYKEVSQKINNKRGYQAVGNAAGANPLPIIIPCHRVIGSDKKLTGYNGGLDIKKKLLTIEGYLQDSFPFEE